MRKIYVFLLLSAAVLTLVSGFPYEFLTPFQEDENCKEQEFPKLPEIDVEEGMKYLDEGECMGAELPDHKFSFWFCKPVKTRKRTSGHVYRNIPQ